MDVQEYIESINARHVATAIAPYGKISNGIRQSRPTGENGMVQYVWRMARFHMGEDTHMPVTCAGWLQKNLEARGVIPERAPREWDFDAYRRREIMKQRRETQREVEKKLEPIITEVVEIFGGDDTVAARRWKRAGLFS